MKQPPPPFYLQGDSLQLLILIRDLGAHIHRHVPQIGHHAVDGLQVVFDLVFPIVSLDSKQSSSHQIPWKMSFYLVIKRPLPAAPLFQFLWFLEESAVPSSSIFHIPSSSTAWLALHSRSVIIWQKIIIHPHDLNTKIAS